MFFHASIPASRANGPGLRAVVFFQGCTLGCPAADNLQGSNAGFDTGLAVVCLERKGSR